MRASKALLGTITLTCLMLALAITGAQGEAAVAAEAPALKRPNIVFIMTDDQTLESLRVMRVV